MISQYVATLMKRVVIESTMHDTLSFSSIVVPVRPYSVLIASRSSFVESGKRRRPPQTCREDSLVLGPGLENRIKESM